MSGSVSGMVFSQQKARARAAIYGGASSNVLEEDGPEGAAVFGFCEELIDIEGASDLDSELLPESEHSQREHLGEGHERGAQRTSVQDDLHLQHR